ncbi:DCLK3 [Bugula neritina]|uniref:DCLK3 n=1 Tax=Bugula neritina TaxID=10212 RepID=A0A7J7K2T8_BUGNE|nr:DCLK3 [Bugula neritina]
MKLAKSKEERLVDLDEIKTQFDIGRVLGDGNFAVVNACQHRDTGHEYAMKIIDKSKLRGKEHMIDNEIAIMKACHQENLVKLYEEFETREEIYLVMEYVKGGDLFDAIKNSVRFTEPVASKMSADMTNALFYLHSRGIVHRDVKPENLMVMRNKDNSMTLKLGDFEIGYGLEVDMWAVGIITYILLCGFPPFRATDNKQTELFEYIKAGEYEFLSPYWDAVSAEAIDLIRHLLVVDKRSRYTAVEVLCHPWIITVGGSKELPDLFPQYQEKYREVIIAQGKANYAEWKEHRGRIFANSNHNTSLTKL